jgi:bacteriocin-like protein
MNQDEPSDRTKMFDDLDELTTDELSQVNGGETLWESFKEAVIQVIFYPPSKMPGPGGTNLGPEG